MEGLVCGWAYLWREICVSKSIGLALYLGTKLTVLLSLTLYLRGNFQLQAPGAYIWRGDLTEGFNFCVTSLGGLYLEGLIHGGAYFWNFSV